MNQIISLQQLADRLVHVEKEMSALRQELMELRQQARGTRQAAATPPSVPCPWSDKGKQRRWINRLFTDLSIQGAPLGALTLQQKMGQADLTPNELSQSLIDAREE